MKKFYGKYRGTVVNAIDPMLQGRVRVEVPGVLGDAGSNWAMPCVPMAAMAQGMLAIPPVGAHVWVEFERGNADFPIWTGGFWANAAEMPDAGGHRPVWVFSHDTGFVLKTGHGAMIRVDEMGIFLSNGKGAMVTLVGPEVSINNGALVVV